MIPSSPPPPGPTVSPVKSTVGPLIPQISSHPNISSSMPSPPPNIYSTMPRPPDLSSLLHTQEDHIPLLDISSSPPLDISTSLKISPSRSPGRSGQGPRPHRPPSPVLHPPVVAPRRPFVRPEKALAQPENPEQTLALNPDFADTRVFSSVWRISLSNVRLIAAADEDDDFFEKSDWMRLSVSSSNFVSDGESQLELGPFRLDSFAQSTFEAVHGLKEYFRFSLRGANAGPEDVLCLSRQMFNVIELKEGFVKEEELRFSMSNYYDAFSGIVAKARFELLQIRMPHDEMIERIFPDKKYGDAILCNEKSTLRLSLSRLYKGEFWALSQDNQARERAGVPHCGGVEVGGFCSGVSADGHPGASEKYRGKPLSFFLRAERLNRLLPQVPDWNAKFPMFKLEVLTRTVENGQAHEIYNLLSLNKVEIKPWYNFESWNVAYPKENWTKRLRFYDGDPTTLAKKLEVALNHEVKMFADSEKGFVVFYGNTAFFDDVEIRGMHVTVPVDKALLAGINPPTILF